MMRKHWIVRMIAAALALVLLTAGIGIGAPRAQAASSDKWKSNLLTTDPMGVFGFGKELIGSVTFLDSTQNAPRNAWNLGKGASPRVKGWVVWQDGLANIYIAAKGGINGEACTEALFEDCTALEEVSFGGAFHTENAKSMKNMFHGCENLLYVDTENLDTSNVTDMYQMFRNCYALEELDVSSFDTAKVTNMEGMFRWCYALEEPDLSGWDVSRVKKHSGFMDEGMTVGGLKG